MKTFLPETDTAVKEATLRLFEYLRDIVNKNYHSLPPSFESEDFQKLSDAVAYLAENISEAHVFLTALCAGQLNVSPPGRYNFLAGELKELQAGLLHLVWQANQVAKGDYGQQVRFFGEFSDAFNKMISQLEEREKALEQKAEAAAQSMTLLTEVINSIRKWVFVVDAVTAEIIFLNDSAKGMLEKPELADVCGKNSELYRKITEKKYCLPHTHEELCAGERFFSIETYFIEWCGRGAYAHLISDITTERAHEEHLEDIAFKDALTGVYNRWYCLRALNNLLKQGAAFSVCFVDLDGLKYVNDTLGHTSGDEYLVTVAVLLKNMLRQDDVLCRIGGDEYVILLIGCPQISAERKIAAIRRKLIAKSKKYPMSISYGIMYITGDKMLDSEEILAGADKLMYSFKKKNSPFRDPGRPPPAAHA